MPRALREADPIRLQCRGARFAAMPDALGSGAPGCRLDPDDKKADRPWKCESAEIATSPRRLQSQARRARRQGGVLPPQDVHAWLLTIRHPPAPFGRSQWREPKPPMVREPRPIALRSPVPPARSRVAIRQARKICRTIAAP